MHREHIFVVGRDPRGYDWVRRELVGSYAGRLCGVAGLEQLLDVLPQVEPAALLHASDDPVDMDEVCRLLTVASRCRWPVPVVVVAPRYDVATALRCFRLGVADFLGRAEHRGRLDEVLRLLNGRRPTSRVLRSSPTPAERFATLAD